MTTADVLMAAREPDLLHILPGSVRRRPQRWRVGTAHLVNRHRVPTVTDVRVQCDVMEIVAMHRVQRVEPTEIIRDAQRPHRVPNADEVDGDILGAFRVEPKIEAIAPTLT